MSMSGPPEPEWVGQMEFTCSAEVHRKFITPNMARIIRSFADKPNDPWAEHRSPEQREQLRVRMMQSRINDLLREVAVIEPMDRTCGWEGETEAIIYLGRLEWTCPACGEEHTDPVPDEDGPEPYDTMKEAMGLA